MAVYTSKTAKIAVSALFAAAMALVSGIGTEAAARQEKSDGKGRSCGGASWYAMHTKTSSGERMNAGNLTAAHRSLAFGTRLLVTNNSNGRSVVVRVNDRGPFIRGRVLDLSRGAATQIGMIGSGVGKVCYKVVNS